MFRVYFASYSNLQVRWIEKDRTPCFNWQRIYRFYLSVTSWLALLHFFQWLVFTSWGRRATLRILAKMTISGNSAKCKSQIEDYLRFHFSSVNDVHHLRMTYSAETHWWQLLEIDVSHHSGSLSISVNQCCVMFITALNH